MPYATRETQRYNDILEDLGNRFLLLAEKYVLAYEADKVRLAADSERRKGKSPATDSKARVIHDDPISPSPRIEPETPITPLMQHFASEFTGFNPYHEPNRAYFEKTIVPAFGTAELTYAHVKAIFELCCERLPDTDMGVAWRPHELGHVLPELRDSQPYAMCHLLQWAHFCFWDKALGGLRKISNQVIAFPT